MMHEPVCAYGPGSPLMDRWREREEKPLVVLRCGRGRRRCRRALVEVYESPAGALVRFYRSSPDAPVRGSAEALTLLEQRDKNKPGGVRAPDDGRGTALLRGRRDRTGWLVALESDDYWHDVVQPGCQQHGGADRLSRAVLMDWVRRARRGENLADATV